MLQDIDTRNKMFNLLFIGSTSDVFMHNMVLIITLNFFISTRNNSSSSSQLYMILTLFVQIRPSI